MSEQPQYRAYLSYSHRDEDFARRLHDYLETFRVPGHLVRAGKPRRLSRIFRDRTELPSSGDLGQGLKSALAGSDSLIVVCSPEAARSRWVNEEVLEFKRAHGGARVLPIIIDGEPPGCFPPALLQQVDAETGAPTEIPAEPVAADARTDKDGLLDARLKIVAGLLDVNFDELKQRELHRRYRRLGALTAVTASLAVVMSVLLVFALAARNDAERLRGQAEGLISFMIGDLRDQLEAVGKLSILDSVGDRAVAFYNTLEKEDLTDEVLATRAQALRQIGEVRLARGQSDEAMAAFSQSLSLARELSVRHPEDNQQLFDVGQAHYWLGYVEYRRQNLEAARASFLEYDAIAEQLLNAEPDNYDYQLEAVYAQSNLGTLALQENDFKRAQAYFTRSVSLNESMLLAFPDDAQLRHELAEGLSWLGGLSARLAEPGDAISWYERELEIRQQLADVESTIGYRQALANTQVLLADQYFLTGDLASAVKLVTDASAIFAELVEHDPSNTGWASLSASSFNLQSEILLSDADDEALAVIDSAIAISQSLSEKDPSNVGWRIAYAGNLQLRARAQLANENQIAAALIAQKAIDLLSQVMLATPTPSSTRIEANLYLTLGDAFAAQGDIASAEHNWQEALRLIESQPGNILDPRFQASRVAALSRSDLLQEAVAVRDSLVGRGYAFDRVLVWPVLDQ
jgi:tetratricopeptide (TPR) repeat protein